MTEQTEKRAHFIRQLIIDDLASGKHQDIVTVSLLNPMAISMLDMPSLFALILVWQKSLRGSVFTF